MESVAKLLVPEKTSKGYLPGFVQLLDQELKKFGISPQFGLVGFSGKAPVHRPGHVHTIKGRFFSDAKDFTPEVIENMEFAERFEFVLFCFVLFLFLEWGRKGRFFKTKCEYKFLSSHKLV